MAKTTRVQLDFSPEEMDDLAKVKKITNQASRKGAIGTALKVILLLDEYKKAGYELKKETEKGSRSIDITW